MGGPEFRYLSTSRFSFISSESSQYCSVIPQTYPVFSVLQNRYRHNYDGMLCNDSSVDDKKCGIISMYRSVTITLQLS
ncbi:unnamed protein product [Brugia pahangi]|uniref:Ovule protein n=1 Tax=Brugia pahangi TaxID=6280 RepID=A0A0N4TVP0_BRUPA|nr:unnamed protein product [Brugia pahangi]